MFESPCRSVHPVLFHSGFPYHLVATTVRLLHCSFHMSLMKSLSCPPRHVLDRLQSESTLAPHDFIRDSESTFDKGRKARDWSKKGLCKIGVTHHIVTKTPPNRCGKVFHACRKTYIIYIYIFIYSGLHLL